jgi:hypothetical protein
MPIGSISCAKLALYKLIRKFFLLLLLFFIFLLSSKPTFAETTVVINEFFSDGSNDWIELYNNSDAEVNLNGWVIKDTASSPVYTFKDWLIPKQGFCVVDVSSRLNNNGDRIELYKENDVVDCVAYGDGNKQFCEGTTQSEVKAPSNPETAGSTPDGGVDWVIKSVTREYSNSAESEPETKNTCYLQSTPTQIPPTSTPPPPTNTSVPATNTPIPATKAPPKPTTKKVSPRKLGSVLGRKAKRDFDIFLPTASPSAFPTAVLESLEATAGAKRRRISYIFFGLGALALAASGFSAYRIHKTTNRSSPPRRVQT